MKRLPLLARSRGALSCLAFAAAVAAACIASSPSHATDTIVVFDTPGPAMWTVPDWVYSVEIRGLGRWWWRQRRLHLRPILPGIRRRRRRLFAGDLPGHARRHRRNHRWGQRDRRHDRQLPDEQHGRRVEQLRSLISATGGGGGNTVPAGGTGGHGGSGSGGQFNITGQDGQVAQVTPSPTGAYSFSTGGASPRGGVGANQSVGGPGGSPGGGGSRANHIPAGSVGGNGAPGAVLIRY